MLKRLYVDNFKAFVNFELRLDGHALLLGSNGSGKSTLLDVLSILRKLTVEAKRVEECAGEETETRWDKRNGIQTYELELAASNGLYLYRVVLDHSFGSFVSEESLELDGEPLLLRSAGEAEIPKAAATYGPTKVVVDLERSSIPLIVQAHKPFGKIQPFIEALGRVGIFRPQPREMTARTEKESSRLEPTMANFASWWRLKWQEEPEVLQAAIEAIARVLPGFKSMSVQRRETDEHRMLKTRWSNGDSSKGAIEFNFDELSDGQRVLIALQSIAEVLSATGGTLVLDEPDNFLALAEIQPLIRSLLDTDRMQVIIASHHPEVLNEMARDYGIRLWRDRNGPVRQQRFAMPAESGLTPAEHVAQRMDEADG